MPVANTTPSAASPQGRSRVGNGAQLFLEGDIDGRSILARQTVPSKDVCAQVEVNE